MDRGTLIRSHVVADLGNILHSRHQYHWHTGYIPPQTVAAPHLGSWIARVRGPRNPAIPAFINIGQRLEGHGEVEELKAFTTAGFFGSEYGPFNIPFPAGRDGRRAAAQGCDPRAVRPPGEDVPATGQGRTAGGARKRLPSRVDGAGDGQCVPASELARARRLRPVEGAEGELRSLRHRPIRSGLPARPAVDRGRGAVHRSNDRVRPVPELGYARERPRHVHGNEETDRPTDRPARPRPGSARAARIARSSWWPASSAAT